MNQFLVLLAIFALAILSVAVRQTAKTQTQVFKAVSAKNILPKAVTALVVSAHAVELIKVVEHASIVNIVAALLLLAILLASRSGTEGGLH